MVENRPGAVGVVAANYMYNVAKPDGLTIGVMFGMVTQGLMSGDGIKYDPALFPDPRRGVGDAGAAGAQRSRR